MFMCHNFIFANNAYLFCLLDLKTSDTTDILFGTNCMRVRCKDMLDVEEKRRRRNNCLEIDVLRQEVEIVELGGFEVWNFVLVFLWNLIKFSNKIFR